jgi:hypothetical protein
LLFIPKLLGIKAANSHHPCIDCECHSNELWNTLLVSRKRDFDRQNEELPKNENNRENGYDKAPLIDIPYENQIPESMHMEHRMGDKLKVNFLNDCMLFDGNLHDEMVHDNQLHRASDRFLTLVKRVAKINIQVAGKTYGEIKNNLKRLKGYQSERIFASINIYEHFHDLFDERARITSWLWETFYKTMRSLSDYEGRVDQLKLNLQADIQRADQNPALLLNNELRLQQQQRIEQMRLLDSPDQAERERERLNFFSRELDTSNKYWVNIYIHLYGQANVTPYIHRFAHHLGESYRTNGNINFCSCEGFEKSHHLIRLMYERANNKQRGTGRINKYLRPLLMKTLRLAYFQRTLNYFYNSKGKKIYNQERLENDDEIENDDFFLPDDNNMLGDEDILNDLESDDEN